MSTPFKWLVLPAKVALVAVTILSLTGFLGSVHLVFDLTSHFRVQYYLLASAFLIGFILMRNWRWALLSLIPLFVNGLFIFPWFLSSPPRGERDLRVLVSNVEAANSHYDSIRHVIREADADLVVLVETDFKWIAEIKYLKEIYPYRLIRARRDFYGISIFSRYPLEAEPPVYTDRGEIYTHVVDVLKGDRLFTLIAVHPPPPVSIERFTARNRAYEEIALLAHSRENPVIVAGDFNTTMWSPLYRRLIRDSGLVNVREGIGILATWPAFLLDLFRIPLDHCLVSPNFKVSRVMQGKKNDSDHFPLIVDLRFL